MGNIFKLPSKNNKMLEASLLNMEYNSVETESELHIAICNLTNKLNLCQNNNIKLEERIQEIVDSNINSVTFINNEINTIKSDLFVLLNNDKILSEKFEKITQKLNTITDSVLDDIFLD
jgi:hypothetical protein